MSTDTREAILVQLESLLASVSGVASVWRDRGLITEDMKLPSIILLDGREEATMDPTRLKGVKDAPKIMALRPQIILVLYPRAGPTNLAIQVNGKIIQAPVGPELSVWRQKIRAAVINDPTLINIIGGPRGEGQILYEGCVTDMEQGGSLYGSMLLNFCVRYILPPPQA